MPKKTEENKVLMETFKGFDIFYDKEKERFVVDKDEFDRHFESRSLWEMKGMLKETQTKEIDKEAIIKSGYLDKSLSKIRLLTINEDTKRVKYKILSDTDKDYDVGKIKTDMDAPKTYELSEHNLKIYANLEKLSEDIEKIEAQQVELVKQVK